MDGESEDRDCDEVKIVRSITAPRFSSETLTLYKTLGYRGGSPTAAPQIRLVRQLRALQVFVIHLFIHSGLATLPSVGAIP